MHVENYEAQSEMHHDDLTDMQLGCNKFIQCSTG